MNDIIKYNMIIEKLSKAKNVIIICHINPDGDTLGAGLALRAFLLKKGKETVIVCDDNYNNKLSILPNIDSLNVTLDDIKKYDVAVAVDCSDMDRLGYKQTVFNKAFTKLSIDHHKTNTKFADVTLYEDVCATCELMYKLLCYWDKSSIDKEIATALMCGIITDSGAFSFSSTTDVTFGIVAELYNYGIDVSSLIHHFTKSVSLNAFKLRSHVLNKCRFECDNKVGIIFFNDNIFKDTGTNITETEGIINHVINIDSVVVAIAITEVGSKYYKVSFRTKDPVDASDCAMVFGGGGHQYASGCRISGFYEDVIDKLVKVCSDRL